MSAGEMSIVANPEVFGFLAPGALWLLLLLGLVLAVVKRTENIRASIWLFFGQHLEDSASNLRSYLYVFVLLVSLILIVAIARPYWGKETIHAPKSFGEDIFIILDVSESMLTKDVSPNRLAAAKLALSEGLEKLVEKPANRIGLILFAGDAYTYCPLTADYGVLKQFVDAVSTDMISTPGTNLSAAFNQLKNSLPNGTTWLRVVLITDGEDPRFDPGSVASLLGGSKYDVIVFGVGTAEGAPIEKDNGTLVKDKSGNIVISRLNKDALSNLADSLHGKYQTLNLADESLAKVLTASRLSKTAGGQENYVNYGELTSWFSLSALLILVLWRGVLGQLFVFALVLLPLRSYASPYQGFKAYQEGDYQTAKEKFSGQQDPESLQALGSSEYKLKSFEDAAKHFEEALKSSRSDSQKFDNLYNLGNAAFRRESYEQAVENYEQALKLKPDDKEAKHNLEVAKRKLQQKQNQQSKSDDKDDRQKKSDSEQQKDQSQQQQSQQTKQDQSSTESEQNQKEEQKQDEAQPKPSAAPENPQEKDQRQAAAPPSKLNAQELKKEEAQQWLDSLPEAPVLLQRPKRDRRTTDEQTW